MLDARRRVLIIDDNLALAHLISEMLESDGHITDVAGTAEEALSMVVPIAPDVVLTDYHLPGLNGPDLIRGLRQMGLRPAAIVISASTDDCIVSEALAAGAAFVSKPVDFRLLCPLIREAQASVS